MLRVLVTGFGPFTNVPINPTQSIIEELQSSGWIPSGFGNEQQKIEIQITYVVLEVSTVAVEKELSNRNDYDVYIHLGVAMNSTRIRLEKFA